MIYNASSDVKIDILFGKLPEKHCEFLLTNAFIELPIVKEIHNGALPGVSSLWRLLEETYPWTKGLHCFGKIDARLVFNLDSSLTVYAPIDRHRWERIYNLWDSSASFLARAIKRPVEQVATEIDRVKQLKRPSLSMLIGDNVALWIKRDGLDKKLASIVLFELAKESLAILDTFERLFSEKSERDFHKHIPESLRSRLMVAGFENLDDPLPSDAIRLVASLFPDLDTLFLLACKFDSVEAKEVATLLLDWVARLNNQQLTVLQLRYGTKEEPEHTLQEIGNIFQITRERVRQIEQKAFFKLRQATNSAPLEAFLKLFVKTRGPEKYWMMSDIDDLFNSSQVASVVRLIPALCGSKWFFVDNETGIMFLTRSEAEFKSVIDGILKDVPDALSQEAFESLDGLKKKVALRFCRFYFHKGFYLKMGLGLREEYLRTIRDLFPQGYRIYNDDDYALFVKRWVAEKGEEVGTPTAAAVRSVVSSAWRLCDDGTYLPSEALPVLTDDLRRKMNAFIDNHLPAVYYKSIFMAFEKEARAIGIVNPAMLKGAFDEGDNRYVHCKDYLKDKNWLGSCYDAIKDYVLSLDGSFSFDDLRVRFPHVENHVFLFCLSKWPEVAAPLSKTRYLVLKPNAIDFQAASDLATLIHTYLDRNGLEYVACAKILEKLRFAEKTGLLKRLRYVSDEWALANVVRIALFDEFDVSGLFICQKGVRMENRREAFIHFLSEKEEFDKADIDYAAMKMGFSCTFSFLEIAEMVKKTHTQIDKDRFTRTSSLIPNEELRLELSAIIGRLIDNYGLINTQYFVRYFLLPTIPKVSWNKYVLAGIVRSCFEDDYVVQATHSDYRVTDFIIKRREL